MGDQLSVHRSCCPVVVDEREIYFEEEQKKLIDKQTNSPYRHHRRQSSSITNHSPIPLFCSKPKKCTFYFATLTPQPEPLKNGHRTHTNGKSVEHPNQKGQQITLLQHGELQFTFNSKAGPPSPGSSLNTLSNLAPTVQLSAPSYLDDKLQHKLDTQSNALMLKSQSYLTNIEWFFYGDSKKDTEAALIVTDSSLGFIHEIDAEFNVTQPLAKICRQDNVGVVQILRLDSPHGSLATHEDRMKERGYDITWTSTKNGELLFGSTGMEYNTSVIRYTRSRELFAQDWREQFNRIRYACGAVYPGWIWIECMLWSHIHDKWFIFPRYLSVNAPFNETMYRNYGCNVMLTANENFKEIHVVALNLKIAQNNNEAYVKSLYKSYDALKENVDIHIDYAKAKGFGIQTMKDLDHIQKDEVVESQKAISRSLCYSEGGVSGFTSAQFLAGSNDQVIMGIRTLERKDGSKQSSVCVFNVHGDMLLEERVLDSSHGYKGLVFL